MFFGDFTDWQHQTVWWCHCRSGFEAREASDFHPQIRSIPWEI